MGWGRGGGSSLSRGQTQYVSPPCCVFRFGVRAYIRVGLAGVVDDFGFVFVASYYIMSAVSTHVAYMLVLVLVLGLF